MAAKRNPRRKPARRNARRRSPARRSPRRKPARRRRGRRRKNPAGYGGVALAVLGGVLMGTADWALQGKLDKMYVGLIEVGGGLVLGGLAMMVQKELGIGIIAGGAGVGSATILDSFLAPPPSGLSAVQVPLGGGMQAQLAAVHAAAQLGAVQVPLGQGMEAQLAAVGNYDY